MTDASKQPLLTIALPKGRLTSEAVALLGQAGLDASAVLADSRGLVSVDHGARVQFLLAKPFDVPTFVEAGAADVGIVGKDVLLETDPGVVELLDLGIGLCRLQLALPARAGGDGTDGPDGALPRERGRPLRVATRYPRTAGHYFEAQGIPAQVIALHGSIELAPRVGLADAIVDLVQTGRTLAANGLVPVATLHTISARLIANPVRWKLKHDAVRRLLGELRAVVASQRVAAGRTA
ncbi:ATP phosphoribosyltransferase [Carboxydochorda subterranea]|uniref:ATP phosphoribosyltransferase n=1 Tax=Carboxydichorda subterranea TaxID=3109565 RepID=A0ABZ1BV51_9FIRM|nr:ATP phosphoribosyltransferase [Limnochorda sp. L945t]WRP16370.1 ATP phosphoribosyltransferase [Limnochorda sp. L945t]